MTKINDRTRECIVRRASGSKWGNDQPFYSLMWLPIANNLRSELHASPSPSRHYPGPSRIVSAGVVTASEAPMTGTCRTEGSGNPLRG